MRNLTSYQPSAKINWGDHKAKMKQAPVKFTDADLYSEESEIEAILKSPRIKIVKRKAVLDKIF